MSRANLLDAIHRQRVYVVCENARVIGWMRYGLFWDSIPFLNMRFLLAPYRAQGLGREMLSRWERDMKAQGYVRVMTSSQSDETAQHFYQKMGYRAVGSFWLPDQALELLFLKKLK